MPLPTFLLSNREDRNVENFFAKIRQSLAEKPHEEDGVEPPEFASIPPAMEPEHNQNIPEEELYAKISNRELQQVMRAYSAQQETNRKDEPVTCEQIPARSFEKLLHSKAALYSPNSTDYLVKKLGITDDKRMSFLGGLSTYDLYKDENIEALVRYDAKRHVDQRLAQAYHLISIRDFDGARKQILEAYHLDTRSGDVLGCFGALHSNYGDHKKAMEKFNQAFEMDIFDREKVTRYYVEALCEYGQHYLRRRYYKEAIEYFNAALGFDPNHQSSKFHLEMASKHLPGKKFKPDTSLMEIRK